jgi:uncharacterized membrane protein YkvA (DUF1232 family)
MLFEGLNYPEMWKKAKEHYDKGVGEVDENDVAYAAHKGKAKLQVLGKAPEGLEQVWTDLAVMVQLCQDYNDKKYLDIPWDNMQKIAGAVSYFVSPFDLVPDGIPKIGYLDDAAVIRHVLKKNQDDISRYREWLAVQGH